MIDDAQGGMRVRLRIALAMAAAMVVAGCVSMSSSDTIKPLPEALVHHAYVADITIKALPGNVPPDFRDLLLAALRKRLSECAKGTRPLRLDASVAMFSGQNPGKTILVGDSDVIKGSAQLIDPADNAVLGDFDIVHSLGGGGLIAAAYMGHSQEKMAEAFADEVCHRAFGATD